mgnify:FL=1
MWGTALGSWPKLLQLPKEVGRLGKASSSHQSRRRLLEMRDSERRRDGAADTMGLLATRSRNRKVSDGGGQKKHRWVGVRCKTQGQKKWKDDAMLKLV